MILLSYTISAVNVIDDALSHKSIGSLRHTGVDKLEMTKDLYRQSGLSV